MNKYFLIIFTLGSLALLLGSWLSIIPVSITESLGFITGAATVWLVVIENIWNWPIGIANAIFFIFLFFEAKLYADMSLQVVYVTLGFLGWYWWLKGGKNKTELKVSTISLKEIVLLALIGIISTVIMTNYLQSIHDSAPFLDALTTVLSLIAQYMLTRKFLENWYVWITADIIYIGLYAYKSLYLTSILYFIFMVMCIIGLIKWKKTHQKIQLELALLKHE